MNRLVSQIQACDMCICAADSIGHVGQWCVRWQATTHPHRSCHQLHIHKQRDGKQSTPPLHWPHTTHLHVFSHQPHVPLSQHHTIERDDVGIKRTDPHHLHLSREFTFPGTVCRALDELDRHILKQRGCVLCAVVATDIIVHNVCSGEMIV